MAVFVLTMFDRNTVVGKVDQRSVEFGVPLAWVHQDQTLYDPPFPWQARLSSPMESATSVSLGALLINVLVLVTIVTAVAVALVTMRRIAVPRRG